MVPAVPVPVAGAQAVVAQVEASAADVAGKDTDTLKIHILGGKKGILRQLWQGLPFLSQMTYMHHRKEK